MAAQSCKRDKTNASLHESELHSKRFPILVPEPVLLIAGELQTSAVFQITLQYSDRSSSSRIPLP